MDGAGALEVLEDSPPIPPSHCFDTKSREARKGALGLFDLACSVPESGLDAFEKLGGLRNERPDMLGDVGRVDDTEVADALDMTAVDGDRTVVFDAGKLIDSVGRQIIGKTSGKGAVP